MPDHAIWTRFILPAGALVVAASAAIAEVPDNWPRWRGTFDNGSAESGTYPVKWGANSGLLWKTPLPGKGCSTPIVWDKRIYLTAPVAGEDAVLAFDWSGKPLWQTTLGKEIAGKHGNGSGSNPSPTTDGHGLFVCFKSTTLAALELDGKLRWKTNLQERFGKLDLFWDACVSPVLTTHDVVVAVLHHGDSYLAAFNKSTGELHWKVARNYKTPTEGDHGYATPLLIRHEGRDALLVWGGQHLTAHDAADGKLLWDCGDFNPDATDNWPAVASPVVADGIAVVPYGRGNRLHGIRLGGAGDVTASHRIWQRMDTGSFVPTPAVSKGRVYLLRDRGQVECIDPASGKTLWSGKLPNQNGSYYASPAVADGKLYAVSEEGLVIVVRLGDPLEILSQNDMGEQIIASPVPVAGRLLLRGEKYLFCVGAE
jgi:outer membrane protein assembly factor BamB